MVTPAAYKVKEFAKALDVSERTVWSLIKRGEISSLKVGRCRRIPASELTRLMGENEEGVPQPRIPISPRATRIVKQMRG